MDRVPYTYLLKCVPENKYYYGVRFAKNCDPSDFWVTYFTSSKVVKQAVEKYGKEAFIFEIRQTFLDKDKALAWEQKVLHKINVRDREDFYNKTNHGAFPDSTGKKHSEATKKKIGDGNKGKIVAQESVDKARATKLKNNIKPSETALKNLLFWATQPKTANHKSKISKATTGKSKNVGSNNPMCGNGYKIAGTKNGRSCSWRIINNYTSEEFVVENLAEFCEAKNIKINTLYSSQKFNSNKKWFLQKLKQNRINN